MIPFVKTTVNEKGREEVDYRSNSEPRSRPLSFRGRARAPCPLLLLLLVEQPTKPSTLLLEVGVEVIASSGLSPYVTRSIKWFGDYVINLSAAREPIDLLRPP